MYGVIVSKSLSLQSPIYRVYATFHRSLCPRVYLPKTPEVEPSNIVYHKLSPRRYQGTAYNSQCAKVNYPNVTTSATIYAEADRGVPPSVNFSNPFSFPTIPSLFQLLKPPSPFNGLIQRPLMPHYDEVAQDYVPILRVSQYCGLVTVYPYPDNENVSSFGQPPFAHYATTGPVVNLAPAAVFPGYIHYACPRMGRPPSEDGSAR